MEEKGYSSARRKEPSGYWAQQGFFMRILISVAVNLALLIGAQCLFLHNVPGPVTAETLAAHPYFAGCTVLDVQAGPASTIGNNNNLLYNLGGGESAFVLYIDAAGAQKLVKVDRNLLFNRWGPIPWAAQDAPEDGVVEMNSYLGHYNVTVAGGRIADLESVLFTRATRGLPALALVVGALFMQGVEATALGLARRAKKRWTEGA